MVTRSIKKGMRRMGMENVGQLKEAQVAAMVKGLGPAGVKMIVGDDKVREEKCLAKFRSTLEVFKCAAIPMVTLGGGSVKAWVRIVGPGKDQEESCLGAVEADLSLFDCIMIPEITVGGEGIQNNVRIKAKPRE